MRRKLRTPSTMRPRALPWAILLVTAMIAQACGHEGTNANEATRSGQRAHRPTVFTVNYPLMYFARRIGGEKIEVVFPAPREIDPAFWMPTPEQILAYQGADLILMNGADYAKWTQVATLPPEKLVDTSAGFRQDFIVIQNAITHSHGPSGNHSHAGTVFTTWIDFEQADAQARAVFEALLAHGLADSVLLRKNFEALQTDLSALDDSLAALTRGQESVPLFASHPIYQYFARRYGLDLLSVQWEPGEFPVREQWEHLAALQKTHHAAWMIWEGAALEESVERLATMGISSVVFDPCANRPEKGDFLSVMRQDVQNLRAIFRD